MSVGDRIRRARAARRLSLNDVALKAHISVATLSRIERDKQGLDLGLFLVLARILRMGPAELIGADADDNADPLVLRIAGLEHGERLQLWRDLATERRSHQRQAARSWLHKLSEEIEELLAQLEYVRTEMETVHLRVRPRA